MSGSDEIIFQGEPYNELGGRLSNKAYVVLVGLLTVIICLPMMAAGIFNSNAPVTIAGLAILSLAWASYWYRRNSMQVHEVYVITTHEARIEERDTDSIIEKCALADANVSCHNRRPIHKHVQFGNVTATIPDGTVGDVIIMNRQVILKFQDIKDPDGVVDTIKAIINHLREASLD